VLNLSLLSPLQREAVTAPDGPLLVIAGPGSGKTTVLAGRIAYLLEERGILPQSILAITFTRKAAQELKGRLSTIVGGAGAQVEVVTFHAFGLKVIGHYAELLGYHLGAPAVYGPEEAAMLLRTAMEERGLDPEYREMHELAYAIENARLDHPEGVGGEEHRALAAVYDRLLLESNAVDYAAMLSLPLRLFREHPEALRLYQVGYRSVLVDEYQDTNRAQQELLAHLVRRHGNLSVVGDPLQVLYSWRGADVRLLLEFQQHFPGTRVVKLEENYRSTQLILDVANALSRQLDYGRELRSSAPPGEPVSLYAANDEQAEASYVVESIQKLLESGGLADPGGAAVLYRTNAQAVPLVLALRERRLPYLVRGGGDLYSRREVRDVLAYLRVSHNPNDADALARIINTPPRGLADAEERLRDEPLGATRLPEILEDSDGATREALIRFMSLLAELVQLSSKVGPAELVDAVLERTCYRRWLGRQRDGQERLARLATFRASVVSIGDASLGEWLADLQLGGEHAAGAEEGGRVVLSTIHAAKGSEADVVFVVGCEEALLPHHRALQVSPEALSRLDEELRVMYVAVTRSRKRLYLTYCEHRKEDGELRRRSRSRFLDPLCNPTPLAAAA